MLTFVIATSFNVFLMLFSLLFFSLHAPTYYTAGQPFCYYCVECETAICSLCSDLSHWSHSIVRMSEAADKEKEHMDALVNGAKAQVSTRTKVTQ